MSEIRYLNFFNPIIFLEYSNRECDKYGRQMKLIKDTLKSVDEMLIVKAKKLDNLCIFKGEKLQLFILYCLLFYFFLNDMSIIKANDFCKTFENTLSGIF